MSVARASLQPLDVQLRHGRAYTFVRRACLAFSLFLVVGLPIAHRYTLLPIVGPPGAVNLFGLELIDPLAGVSALTSSALPALVLVAVLGRFFCGWVCPYVPLLAASNAARWFLTRLGVRPYDLKLPRRTATVVLVGVLALGALFGTHLWPYVYPPSVIGRAAFNAIFFGGLGAGSLLVAVAFGFDTFVSRAGFCRTLCPGGALFSAFSAWSPVTVKLDQSKCTDCTVCDVVCNLGQSPMTGRIDSGCERCGKCVASCPTKALSMGLRR